MLILIFLLFNDWIAYISILFNYTCVFVVQTIKSYQTMFYFLCYVIFVWTVLCVSKWCFHNLWQCCNCTPLFPLFDSEWSCASGQDPKWSSISCVYVAFSGDFHEGCAVHWKQFGLSEWTALNCIEIINLFDVTNTYWWTIHTIFQYLIFNYILTEK